MKTFSAKCERRDGRICIVLGEEEVDWSKLDMEDCFTKCGGTKCGGTSIVNDSD